jgi:hypothetical protein
MCGVDADSHSDDPFDDLTSDELAQMMLNSAVLEALGVLNEHEQQVVRLRFGVESGDARTLEEVAKEFGVTRDRIRQIESKTLAKLRHPHRNQNLRDYLDGGDDATGVREPRRPVEPSLGPGHALEQPREYETPESEAPLPFARLRPTDAAVRGGVSGNGAAA